MRLAFALPALSFVAASAAQTALGNGCTLLSE